MRKARFLAEIVLAAGLLGGCVNVDTHGWQGVAREYKDAYAPSHPDRDRAIQAAREKAIEEGLTSKDLADYEIKAGLRDDAFWWVEFRHEKRKGKTWPDRFVVRVDLKRGGRLFFKDPGEVPPH